MVEIQMDFKRVDHHMAAVVERSNLGESRRNQGLLGTQLSVLCRAYPSTKAILDLSSVGLHRNSNGRELRPLQALLALTRCDIVLTYDSGFFKSQTEVQRTSYERVADAVAEERHNSPVSGEYSIQLLGKESDPLFRLAWYWSESILPSNGAARKLKAAAERDRILAALQNILSSAAS